MAELKLDPSVSINEEEDEATLAAIDRRIEPADEGRLVWMEEARRRIELWLSKSSSPKTR